MFLVNDVLPNLFKADVHTADRHIVKDKACTDIAVILCHVSL